MEGTVVESGWAVLDHSCDCAAASFLGR